MFKLFFILIFLNVIFAQEDTRCNYRNLMDDNWLKLRNQVRTTDRFIDMPAYDQGRTGTCYAFAATQLVDYWRQTRGFMPEPRIHLASPIHMAMVYKTAMKKTDKLDGGLIFEAVMALRNYGVCPKEIVNRDIKEFLSRELGGFKITGDQTGAQVEEDVVFTELTQGFIIQQTGAHGGDGNFNSLDPKLVSFPQYLSWTKSKSQRETIKKMDEKTLKRIYEAFMKYFSQGNYVGFVNEVLKSCSSRENRIAILDQMPVPRNYKVSSFDQFKKTFPTKKDSEYMISRKAQYRDMIRSLLNRKNAPAVGLAYCSSVLSNPGTSGLDAKGGIGPKCGGHASILVGKREVNGKCQYLLKNSWNSPGICAKHGGCLYRGVRDQITGKDYQEEVGAWVDEENILNNLWFISYIFPETQSEKEIEEKWGRIEQRYIQAGEYFINELKERRKAK